MKPINSYIFFLFLITVYPFRWRVAINYFHQKKALLSDYNRYIILSNGWEKHTNEKKTISYMEKNCFIKSNKINTDKFMANNFFHPHHHHRRAILFSSSWKLLFHRHLQVLWQKKSTVYFLLIVFIVTQRINTMIPPSLSSVFFWVDFLWPFGKYVIKIILFVKILWNNQSHIEDVCELPKKPLNWMYLSVWQGKFLRINLWHFSIKKEVWQLKTLKSSKNDFFLY